MISAQLFPRLSAHNHRITSPSSTSYNCVAWAAGDEQHWWQPGLHWPLPTHPFDDTVEELKSVFQSLGYDECSTSDLEADTEKVALFGSAEAYTHVARQLPDGRWTSKLGNEEDIEHAAPDSVAGGIYGEVVLFMQRPLRVVK